MEQLGEQNKFIKGQLANIPIEEMVIAKNLERNRMREYTENLADALMYKIKIFAKERSMQERERVRRHRKHVARLMNR